MSETTTRTTEDLRQLQALPLSVKVPMSQGRIRAWYNNFNGKVYVSVSGGKDSAVALDLVRQIYPDVKAVFCNTGLEYPEIQSFAKSLDNVEVIYPTMRFNEVINVYGYPLISKEVSDAIYYARKYSKTRERERILCSKRKIQEFLGLRTYHTNRETGEDSSSPG